jgi:hydroxyethylthiazole kinase-like uncharacterized protein yjeF
MSRASKAFLCFLPPLLPKNTRSAAQSNRCPRVWCRMALPNTHLSSATAAETDKRLMDADDIGYKLEQLMELAGLAVATAIAEVADDENVDREISLVLFVCGPGNNGGDGLVAARHLTLMGFARVMCLCPINKFPALTRQLAAFGVPLVDSVPSDVAILVDAVFGFSFKAPLRGPFPAILEQMNRSASDAHLIAVDMPSGWDVDTGERCEGAIREPDTLISLTAPKAGSLSLKNARHYCGGRFVPPSLASELGFCLPVYPGNSQIVRLK